MIKKQLEKMLNTKLEQRKALFTSMIECEDKEQRSAINDTITAMDAEIEEMRSMIAGMPDEPEEKEVPQVSERGLQVIGAMNSANTGKTAENRNNDPIDTPEYRQAFMDFVCRGVSIPAEMRADATTTTSDASAAIPTTLANEIVTKVESYGEIYSRVRKMNVQGGVEISILTLKPSATWISADTATSESDKKKLQANSKITFSYYGLECKIAQTLLTNVTTIQAFQNMFTTLAAEAIAKAMDIAIIKGTGSGQPTGIAVDSKVPAANTITLSASDVASWSAWKKKVFAKMGKSYRNGAFIMAQGTFDGYIDGMVDSNGQPIGRINYNVVQNGGESYRFGGKEVITTESTVISDYDSASSGDVFAIFVNLDDYVINSNMQLQSVRWVDNDTNEIKNKVIMICDGKLVDANGVLIIKKGA